MKKITLLLMLLITSLSFSQVTIGTGNDGSAFNSPPINPYYGFSYSQSIYLASEIGASGDITSIDLALNAGTSITSADDMVDVWIGHTTKSAFDTTTDWVDVSTLTQVLTSGTITASGDVLTITFSSAFTYNGTDNLIIAVDASESGFGGSSDYVLSTDGPTAGMSLTHRSDSVNSDPASPETGVLRQNRGNITFNGITQACATPTALTVANLGTTSVDIGWTASSSGETAWQYVVQAAGGSAPTGAGTDTSVNPTIVTTGLVASTPYEFYVRADCTGGIYSSWVGPMTFTTLCDTFTAPYTQNFDNAGAIPACWSQGTGNVEDWLFADGTASEPGHGGDGGAIVDHTSGTGYFAWINDSSPDNTGTTLESPLVDVSGLTTPALSFWINSDNEGFTNVDFSVDFYDGAAWNTAVYTSNTNTGGWLEVTIDLSTYTITGAVQARFIVDENNGTNFYDDFAIDDVKFDELPTCLIPVNLMVTNLTSTSATFTWDAGSSGETAWETNIATSPSSTPTTSGMANTTGTFNTTTLNENTTYDFWVRASCGGTDYSNWLKITFMTPFTPIVPSYSEDFSTYPADRWSEATGAFMMPTGTSSSFTSDDFGNDTGHANGQSARINIYGTGTDEYLISPRFNLSSSTYYLNFDIAYTAFSGTAAATLGADDFVALLVTEDGTTWTELTRWDSGSTISNTGESISEIALTGYGADVKFAFYAFSDTANEDNNFYIDNFQITMTTLKVESNNLENFSLFPTIVKDNLSFRSQENVDVITIYNIMGQEVFSSKPAVNNASINVSSLSSGMYIVKVKAGNSLGSYKIIKE